MSNSLGPGRNGTRGTWRQWKRNERCAQKTESPLNAKQKIDCLWFYLMVHNFIISKWFAASACHFLSAQRTDQRETNNVFARIRAPTDHTECNDWFGEMDARSQFFAERMLDARLWKAFWLCLFLCSHSHEPPYFPFGAWGVAGFRCNFIYWSAISNYENKW